MVIAFDGANCTGKTPYAEEFSKIFSIKILRYGRFHPFDDGNLEGLLQNDIDKKVIAELELITEIMMNTKLSEDFIIDRFYLSSYVYSTLKKSYLISKEFVYYIEDRMMKGLNKLVNVYLYAPMDILNKRRKDKGETFVSNGECSDELFHYSELLKATAIPTIALDTSDEANIYKNLLNLYSFVRDHGDFCNNG